MPFLLSFIHHPVDQMFLSGLFLSALLSFAKSADAAQSTVVCVAGQCIQGYTNLTIGALLSAPGAPTDIRLLPGQYTTTTNPALLNSLLTNKAATLQPLSQGFTNNGTVSLPLDVALQPGVAVYPQSKYSGTPQFAPLPTSLVGNSSTPVTSQSFALSSNVWLSMQSGSNRIVFWSSVPDVSQLPQSVATGALSILDIQSSSCSPPCSGNGVCSATGTCTCPTGFTGSSCETCAAGFFGPKCQPCPSNCTKCDQGITGTGICLTPAVANLPSTCNCINGVCGSNGQCTCNPGWTTGTNGTSCSACSKGFFLSTSGNCQVCQVGCTQCADGTGTCITCQTGFTQNANDRTKCIAQTAVTSTGTACPPQSFSTGANCSPCSPSCSTCSGPTSNDCTTCASSLYMFNGSCVSADGNGVCAGSSLIADNNKQECDSCPATCTGCKIPGFNIASTVNQLQCTGCLPGFVLSQGSCVQSCPSGTFLNPTSNTCTACDASCSTCSGSSTFCLSCANSKLASSGSCVSSCPSNTFSSSGSCVTCHPDCATCSGGAFNQCSSCSSNLPVLTNGRCLPTCAENQYFDKTTSTCQACDSSCSSCSGPGSSSCLACGGSNQVLRGGSCVNASCNSTTSVIPALGVCLSELVMVPPPSGTGTVPPLPSITGINSPAPPPKSGSNRLQWWQILLMALGCAFIFMVFLMCWRRRARKQRANKTKQFAVAKKLDDPKGWKQRLVRFGERLFGHTSKNKLAGHYKYTGDQRGYPEDSKKGGDIALRDLEEQRRFRDDLERPTTYHDDDLDGIVGAYEYEQSIRSAPSEYSRFYRQQPHNDPSAELDREYNRLRKQKPKEDILESIASRSIYSQVTGSKKRAPEPRLAVRDFPTSRFSTSTGSGSSGRSRTLTPAEEYKSNLQQRELQPNYTGSSENSMASNNPFRKFVH